MSKNLFTERYSPMYFNTGRLVTKDELETLFEAARWAASSYNEQPWHFIYAGRDQLEQFNALLSVLNEYNQGWASSASVLLVAVAAENLQQTGKPNGYALYDTGQAVAQMVLQASMMGLQGHQMGGFDKEKARKELNIPEGYQPVAAIAIGEPAPLKEIPQEFAERANEKRQRKPLSDFTHQGRF